MTDLPDLPDLPPELRRAIARRVIEEALDPSGVPIPAEEIPRWLDILQGLPPRQ